MTKSLPTTPNLEHLKKQAKDLRKSYKNKHFECCEVLKLLNQFKGMSNDEIFNSKLSLSEAQFALALDYGFNSWGDLKKYVLGRTDNKKFMHLLCGDICGQTLRNSTVPGDVQVWMEIFIEGPVPGNVSEEEWRRVRAEFISTQYFNNLSIERALQGANDRYQHLEDARNYKEVILWFDACMFDQTIMIHLIDRLSKLDLGNTKLSLICIGKFLGFEKFNGLGELSPEQMASLLKTRHEITKEEIKLAKLAWEAFTSDNPEDTENIIARDCSALPFLKNALIRFLQKYPSTQNGLNRTQNATLKAVSSGINKLPALFEEVSSFENPRFMGDASFWQVVYDLANCKEPLLNIQGPEKLNMLSKVDREPPTKSELRKWDISITKTGTEVLKGKQDFIKLNGINTWLGGVYLQGTEVKWRWNEVKQSLIQEINLLNNT